MKNVLLCFFLLFLSGKALSQASDAQSPAQSATAQWTQRYGLDATQQAQMLKIQERKYRNLSEIAALKSSDPQLYFKKVKAVQAGNAYSIERMLKGEQLNTFKKERTALREQKATAYKTLKSAGATEYEIEAKMAELDLAAM